MVNENCRLTNPTEDIGYLIWQITKFWQRGKHKSLEEFGLTSSQMEILGAVFHLTKTGKEITQIQLSQETSIDPMTTSTIIRNLQKKGLIDRKESKTDTRARIVELTNSGSELFYRAMTKVKTLQDELFSGMDVEALKAQLQILLDKLNKSKINN